MADYEEELRELRDYASDGEFDDRYVDDGVDKVGSLIGHFLMESRRP